MANSVSTGKYAPVAAGIGQKIFQGAISPWSPQTGADYVAVGVPFWTAAVHATIGAGLAMWWVTGNVRATAVEGGISESEAQKAFPLF